jgi:hypothetical protein
MRPAPPLSSTTSNHLTHLVPAPLLLTCMRTHARAHLSTRWFQPCRCAHATLRSCRELCSRMCVCDARPQATAAARPGCLQTHATCSLASTPAMAELPWARHGTRYGMTPPYRVRPRRCPSATSWHWPGMALGRHGMTLAQHGMALARHGTGMALARAAPLPVCCSHPVGHRSPMTAMSVQPSAVGEVVPGAAGYCAAPERCAVAWLQQCPTGLRHSAA